MNKLQKIKFWTPYLLIVVLMISYFDLVSPFYLERLYEVPDYFKFYVFAKDGLPAQDGFSSLFIAISSQLIINYKLIHYLSLFLMMAAITISLIAFVKVSKNLLQQIIYIAFLFSMGCWYYLYGKVFYEFPFIAFTFSILIYLAKDYLAPPQEASKGRANFDLRNFYPRLFFVLCGFCISWKPHAIFPVFGLMVIASINNRSNIPKHFRNLLFITALIALGFFIGNYAIFTDFIGTVRGIRGYNSGTDVLKFLWSDKNSTWDHTNVLSFHSAVYSLWGSFFILFVSPFLVRSKKILLISNIVFPVLFLFVAYKFLPGYPHNAFPFSLYLAVIVFYVVLNVRPGKATIVLYGGLLLIIGLQGYSIFTSYIPQQESWAKSTKLATQVIEKNSTKIASQVSKIIHEHGPSYRIDLKVKRNSPLNFYNALEMGAPSEWREIFKHECVPPCVAKYQIFIEPIDLYGIPNYQREDLSRAQVTRYSEYVIGVRSSDGKLIYQSF